jgi:hypothetical protein
MVTVPKIGDVESIGTEFNSITIKDKPTKAHRYDGMTAWEAMGEIMDSPPKGTIAWSQYSSVLKVLNAFIKSNGPSIDIDHITARTDDALLNYGGTQLQPSDIKAFRREFGYSD